MNKKALALLFVLVITISGAAVMASDSYDAEAADPTVKDVDLYKLAAETPEKVKLRYYSNMPSVPYIGICQLYNLSGQDDDRNR